MLSGADTHITIRIKLYYLTTEQMKPRKKVIIMLAGRKGAGKNTMACELQSQLEEIGHNVRQFALARQLKEDVCRIRGITLFELESGKEEYRTQLQAYGAGARAANICFWSRKCAQDILLADKGISIITDYRHSDEALYMKELFRGDSDVTTVFITRETGMEKDTDVSEQLQAIHTDTELKLEGSMVGVKESATGLIAHLNLDTLINTAL